ncbi:MAG TPA: hypothetical protein VFR76_06920 [Verrucomicrobiae bacterium]|nr:hypothetical protein [Verrucomicrobiae bacterium]
MSATEILNALPKLAEADRRAIRQRLFVRRQRGHRGDCLHILDLNPVAAHHFLDALEETRRLCRCASADQLAEKK